MKYLIFAIFVFFALVGCDHDCKVVDENFIAAALKEGNIVEIDNDVVSVNGIRQGIFANPFWLIKEKKTGITTGCFSIPECVRMDETKARGVVKISTNDFSTYVENGSEQCPGDITSVTYFLDTFYSPYGAVSSDRNQLRNAIKNQVGLWNGHPDLPGKRLGWCVEKNPHTCYQDEVDAGE
jgi:hypothetical protein